MSERFLGLMKSDDVKANGAFRDSCGLHLEIEAGPKGWTIIWADFSTTFKDIEQETEFNFKEAYDCANKAVGPLEIVEKLSTKNVVDLVRKIS